MGDNVRMSFQYLVNHFKENGHIVISIDNLNDRKNANLIKVLHLIYPDKLHVYRGKHDKLAFIVIAPYFLPKHKTNSYDVSDEIKKLYINDYKFIVVYDKSQNLSSKLGLGIVNLIEVRDNKVRLWEILKQKWTSEIEIDTIVREAKLNTIVNGNNGS